MGFIREAFMKWLGIVPVERQASIVIKEGTTRELTILKNKLWYRGDPVELEQYYQQMAGLSLDGSSMVAQTRFWAAAPVDDNLIRKFHSGLPRMIADKLASIVVNDMNDPETDQSNLTRWEEITEDVDFDDILSDAVARVLSEGDGAFKICVDTTISKYPIIEFYSGNDVEFEYKRGKIVAIKFYTDYFEEIKRYRLCETYGRGFVSYELFDSLGNTVNLNVLDETSGLVNATFEGDYIMAVPFKIYKSPKFKGRGESIFEGKSDMFDALDECLSTWLDAIRAGRVKQYIPEMLIPRNEDTGALRKPNVFNNFIVKNSDLSEDADNKIEVIQGEISYEGLLSSYITLLDCCLQGLISPSTLGIDVKKLDNAESQREKEKTTLYTRDNIIGVMAKVLPRLVEVVLKTEDQMAKRSPGKDYKTTFDWGQYANPSFEAMVETIGKARQYGIMSVERCVDELYGDTMDEKEKTEEIARLKAEDALDVAAPAANDDFGGEGENDTAV